MELLFPDGKSITARKSVWYKNDVFFLMNSRGLSCEKNSCFDPVREQYRRRDEIRREVYFVWVFIRSVSQYTPSQFVFSTITHWLSCLKISTMIIRLYLSVRISIIILYLLIPSVGLDGWLKSWRVERMSFTLRAVIKLSMDIARLEQNENSTEFYSRHFISTSFGRVRRDSCLSIGTQEALLLEGLAGYQSLRRSKEERGTSHCTFSYGTPVRISVD